MNLAVLDERNQVMTLDGVLSVSECTDLIARVEEQGFHEAPITTAVGFVHRPDIRNNLRVMADDVARAGLLWERVRPHVPARFGVWQAIGLNERLRFYRYDPGQYFRWHYDGVFERCRDERSLLTLMVYLNDDFVGGATEFDEGPDVVPRQGMALMFRHPVLHQGGQVLSGRKYVLRSDVMYRRP